MEAIRCRSHALAGTENFALPSFCVVPRGDFRIHIGYLAAASLAATGPAVVICRSHAWPWPEENADVADVCCRGLPVHRVGHLVQNVMRIIEMPSGIAIGGWLLGKYPHRIRDSD